LVVLVSMYFVSQPHGLGLGNPPFGQAVAEHGGNGLSFAAQATPKHAELFEVKDALLIRWAIP
jgi:hypothetical protein